ncbi:MAG: 1-deoxy-D-xylulose-5-phosphate reductoisomerase [Luteibaculum sp.]
MSTKKGICILGSTGSIGTQALEVISKNPERFEVQVLVAGNNWKLLKQQALQFNPAAVVIQSEEGYQQIHDELFDAGIKCYQGMQAICDVVDFPSVDIVLTAMVGAAGLNPTVAAIKAGKTIALANKETLVVAGHIISEMLRTSRCKIIPVDSEHSAIFQCLTGEAGNAIDKIILTASGGPFRGKGRDELAGVTKADALKHPNWEMGAKITIDSATLMNKGLEVIEAKWLFNLRPEQIEVIVHPQSIIHSLVQFEDASMKAQLGMPDMKLPIQYAFSYPDRAPVKHSNFSFANYPNLSFEKPDLETFRNLNLAYECLKGSNGMACVLNAVNEITVQSFLEERIAFLQIAEINARVLAKYAGVQANNLEDLEALDQEVRQKAQELI